MKKIIAFFVLFVTFFFSSCEKDLHEEAITESKSKVNYVTIEEVPFLIPNIQEFNHDYDYLTSSNKKNLNKESLNLNLDLTSILEYNYENGLKSYSILIKKVFSENEDYYFENLHVYEREGVFKSVIFKYNPTDDSREFDINNFTGNLDLYDLEYNHIGIINYSNGEKICVKIIIGCMTIIDFGGGDILVSGEINCDSGGGDGGSGGSGGGGGSGGSGSGGSGSGGSGSGGSGSGGSGSGGSGSGSGGGGNSGGGGSGGEVSGGGGGNIGIYPNSPSRAKQFIINLGIQNSEYFFSLNFEAQSIVYDYLQSINYHATSQVRVSLINILNNVSNSNWLVSSDENTQVSIFNNLAQNNFDSESTAFVNEIIGLASVDPNQEDVNNLINITFLINDNENNLFEDSFAMSLDPYVDLDLVNTPDPLNLLGVKIYFNYRKLRSLNPEWSKAKCFYESSKSVIHIALDAFGLIPVGGEIADLVNGVLYTIEGDGLNATLSYASAVPIIGWTAAGTKFGIRIASTATGVTKLVWKVTGTVIEFGNSGQLRKVLNITSSALQAHHLIPWASRTKTVVQKAAKYINAFHMNEALNGIAVAAWRNQPNHQEYNTLIDIKLNAFHADFPNATPQQCYNFLTNLIQDVRTWVINNPNSHLNNLVLP